MSYVSNLTRSETTTQAGEVEKATFDSQGIVWGLQILSAKGSCGEPAWHRSLPESSVKSASRPIVRFSDDLGFPGLSGKLWAASINRGKKPRALQSGYHNFAGGQLMSTWPCPTISTEQDRWATIFRRLCRSSKLPFANGDSEGLEFPQSRRCPARSALPVPLLPAEDTVPAILREAQNVGQKGLPSMDLFLRDPAKPAELCAARASVAKKLTIGPRATYIWEQ